MPLKSAVELNFEDIERVLANRSVDDLSYLSKGARSKFALDAVPSIDEARRMAESAGIEFGDGHITQVEGKDAPMIVPVWASDERVDRQGDIVRQEWDFTDYNTNPLVLFNHDWDGLPLGSSIEHKVVERSDQGFTGPALRQMFLFTKESASGWDWTERAFRMMTMGVLRTVSVGFFPGRTIRIDDPDEREELGLPEHGLIFEQNKLIETSLVAVPANQGAHVLSAMRKGLDEGTFRREDLMVYREMTRRGLIEQPDLAVKRDLDLLVMWKVLFDGPTPERLRDASEPIVDLASPDEYEPTPEPGEKGADDDAIEPLIDAVRMLTDSVKGLIEINDEVAKVNDERFEALETMMDGFVSEKGLDNEELKGLDVQTDEEVEFGGLLMSLKNDGQATA